MIARLAAFLDARTARERLLLGIAGGAALIWLGHAMVWHPLQAYRERLTDRIGIYDRALADLARAGVAGEAPDAPDAGTGPTDARPLPVIATTTADERGLVIRRLQPTDATLSLTLDDAAFETVLLWIEALEQDHGLRLTSLVLIRRPAPGAVSTELTLER